MGLCTTHKLKQRKDTNIRSKTVNLQEEILTLGFVSDRMPQAQTTKAKTYNWDYVKLKTATRSEMTTYVFANHISDKGPISKIYKELRV